MSFLAKINFKSPLLPLLLLILIDHMGLGLVFPVLVPIYMDTELSILGLDAPPALRSLWYSITLSVFPVAMFFGATLLGGLSDQFGRKKVLLICLLGAAIGYALSGLAVAVGSVGLLVFSRALAGLTSGSMPIAQAAMIDISSPETKAANIGLVILAASFGFLLGPLVGGFFANSNIVSWFNYSTPLYFASIIALVNMWLLKYFKETFVPKSQVSFRFKDSLDFLVAPFKTPSIRFLSFVYLLMQLGWSFYFQFIAVYLLKKHAFSSQDIALFMSLMGIGFALGSCWVLRLLTKYFNDKNAALVTLSLATLCIFATVFDVHTSVAWIASFILGITMAAAYSILIKLFSGCVSEEKQGWIMGVSEAIVAVAWAITPLASTYLEENFSLSVPLSAATLLLLLSTALLRFWKAPSV